MLWMELIVNPQARRAAEANRAAREQGQLAQDGLQPNGAQSQPNLGAGNSLSVNSLNPNPLTPAGISSSGGALAHPSVSQLDASATITIESSDKIITFTHLGARFRHYKLREYRSTMSDAEPLDMVRSEPGAALPLAVRVGAINDNFVEYQLSSITGAVADGVGKYKLEQNADAVLTFDGTLPDGQPIRKIIKIAPSSFLFSVELELPNTNQAPVWLEWATHLHNPDLDHRIDLEQFTLLLESDKLKHLLPQEIQSGQIASADKHSAIWIAFNDKYFAAVIVPTVRAENVLAGREGAMFLARGRGEPQRATFNLYVGPKDYKTLGQLGFQLERLIDLGWFSFLGYPLLWMIRFFYDLLHNYGLAIIALTLVIKGLFLPLNQASFRSMQAMQDLAPEMKALRERVKDPAQVNQEMMALYKRRGVNPMGGCLPVLVQLPVFLGLYNALMNSIEMRHAPFALWIQDLSAPEHLLLFGIPIPVMVIIMGASMFVQQYLTPTATLDPMQRKMMLMMPVVFTVMFIVFPMPAGLVLYWLVSNLISITQQVYMRGDRRASPLTATVIASIAIFSFGYVLTLV